MRILLVEDDMNLGFVVKDNLEQAGYEVDWAVNGEIGYQKAMNNNYQLAILDVMLPKKSGFDIAEDVVERKPE